MDGYLKNRYGGSITEEQFENIPNPAFELSVHVTDKCFQAGCILATTIAAGVTVVKPPRTLGSFLPRLRKYGIRGSLIGIALGPLFTCAKIKGMEEDAIRDRCYRIRHNRNQVRVDQGADAGFVLGPLAAYAMGGSLVTGMVLGVATGTILAAEYNMLAKPGKK